MWRYTMETKMKSLGMDEHIHSLLAEIAESRKQRNILVRNYKDIVAELIIKQHKREVKQ